MNQFNDELSGLLNGLWASDVLDYQFDIIRNRIHFKLRSYNTYTNASRERTLSLERVAGFHFVDSYAEGDEADYLEMMSIDILEEPVTIKQFSAWDSDRCFDANLFFEIWNQEFLVDTRRIVLDDVVWKFMDSQWVKE